MYFTLLILVASASEQPLSPRSIIPALAVSGRPPALNGDRQVIAGGAGAAAVATSKNLGIIPALAGVQRSKNK